MNGGWLEEYVYGVISSMSGIQYSARSIKIEQDYKKSSVKNEIGVALIEDNTLYLIDCKSCHLESEGDSDSEAAETLHKLDTLWEHAGGKEQRRF